MSQYISADRQTCSADAAAGFRYTKGARSSFARSDLEPRGDPWNILRCGPISPLAAGPCPSVILKSGRSTIRGLFRHAADGDLHRGTAVPSIKIPDAVPTFESDCRRDKSPSPCPIVLRSS